MNRRLWEEHVLSSAANDNALEHIDMGHNELMRTDRIGGDRAHIVGALGLHNGAQDNVFEGGNDTIYATDSGGELQSIDHHAGGSSILERNTTGSNARVSRKRARFKL